MRWRYLLKGGGIMYSIQEYLHRFWTKFEHEFAHSGDGGDGGGIYVKESFQYSGVNLCQ